MLSRTPRIRGDSDGEGNTSLANKQGNPPKKHLFVYNKKCPFVQRIEEPPRKQFRPQRSALSSQRSALSSQRSALSPQRSALFSQRNALFSQRSALFSQRSAIRRKDEFSLYTSKKSMWRSVFTLLLIRQNTTI